MSEMFEQQRAEAHLGPTEYALIKAILEQVRVDGPRLLQTDLYMQQYGPFRATTVKAFSITRRTVDGRSLLKIYRGVEPRARRDREVDALKLASQWSLSVPGVLAIGEQADTSWAVLSIVPGTQSSTTTTSQIDACIHRALALTADLCRHVEDLIPGSGWRQDGKDTTSTGHHHLLLGQLSPRCRRQPRWDDLRAALAPLDQEPTVYLHGDIKSEHLLVDGGTVHIVDWEASARGPAARDHAEIMFHLVRDLVYADIGPQRLPGDAIGRVPVTGAVLAWRVVKWLDRRRPWILRQCRWTTSNNWPTHPIPRTRCKGSAVSSRDHVVMASPDSALCRTLTRLWRL
jgi:hypothetical protein